MSSLSINTLMKNLHSFGVTPTKPPAIDRTHFSGGGGGNYHHYHSGGGGGGGGKKHNSIALTALTLLSFLFFLNILQNCLQDQMDQMNPQQQVVILQARLKRLRDAAAQKRKGDVGVVIQDNSSVITKNSRQDRQNHKIKHENNQISPISVKLRTVKGRD